MSSRGINEKDIYGKSRIDHGRLAKRLSIMFILIEAILITSTAFLFFVELSKDYKWLLVSLMVLVSIVGILLGWFIDGASKSPEEYRGQAGFVHGARKKSISLFPIALGIATLVVVVALNSDTGYLTYFVGLFGGILVWLVSNFFLSETGFTES